MKKIFMMLSRGFVARNMLQTEVKKTILEQEDVQLILFVPSNIPDHFHKEANHPRITTIECEDVQYGPLRRRFARSMQKMVYSKTAQYLLHYGGRPSKKNMSWPFFIVAHGFFKLLSSMKFFIPVWRWLEIATWPDKIYDEHFKEHKPDLVIATSLKTKRDAAILKSAKRFNVKPIGITRSWDNLDRMLLQVVPDKLVVQNEAMKEIAIKDHAIDEKTIFVAGFPQFDLYDNSETFDDYETFLEKRNFTPDRKVIFFGSEGAWAPYGYMIAQELIDMANKDEFVHPVQVIVRPHFSDINFDKKNVYDVVEGRPLTYYDNYFRVSKMFTDKWDPSWEEMTNLANQLKHSDMLITYASTLSLEAAILDTPIINIDYQARQEPKGGPFMGTFYQSSHYSRMANSGAIKFAHSRNELKALVNRYLENPEYEKTERKKFANWLAPYTGEAGKRLGDFIIQQLS
ncbi:MAG: hypothetical protein CMI52_02280 [Parcubacteria group bacterium]|nr:hypothetical protein [Parcubacteria group bacterium]